MPGIDELFAQAKAAQARAYAPYSRFPVGAALRTASGAVFVGCNLENAAYPLGICAETSAIAAMISAGERRIAEILVLGPGPGRIAPCGACRQRIAEFGAGALVHLADARGEVETLALADLLPRAFGPDAFKGE
ncbi:cytidine deaminase [Rhodoblastus acidophilus]|uniref:Cytidine deaminase n=1 Tax=Candidatus Rhodoblastus alkanivorans TaxID=2954117 RepID=A0ABS9Z4H0_9HYPH|nr:cytidine deaminase [Candidatus Rhodoblastus alkanivorans]MCI4680669.1 cytidine deaminase [Candidatus Rhodoblastus alkanivorans]MCI4682533.1 cytidine deaminase [Candidatus Rhodoblastus alkanivorans]MDI4639839.1 cytidine deaminase [Rhodoblastus acidophilus]